MIAHPEVTAEELTPLWERLGALAGVASCSSAPGCRRRAPETSAGGRGAPDEPIALSGESDAP
jgi:hypothetical protein